MLVLGLIEAISDIVDPGEERLIPEIVLDLIDSGQIRILSSLDYLKAKQADPYKIQHLVRSYKNQIRQPWGKHLQYTQ